MQEMHLVSPLSSLQYSVLYSLHCDSPLPATSGTQTLLRHNTRSSELWTCQPISPQLLSASFLRLESMHRMSFFNRGRINLCPTFSRIDPLPKRNQFHWIQRPLHSLPHSSLASWCCSWGPKILDGPEIIGVLSTNLDCSSYEPRPLNSTFSWTYWFSGGSIETVTSSSSPFLMHQGCRRIAVCNLRVYFFISNILSFHIECTDRRVVGYGWGWISQNHWGHRYSYLDNDLWGIDDIQSTCLIRMATYHTTK